jgi:hypothetical protein
MVTNHNDVGVMLMANAHSYLLEYYFRALCAVTEGASAKNRENIHPLGDPRVT